LPRLATIGNRIVCADTGSTVYLRGVNRSGLEYSQPGVEGFFAAARFSDTEFDAITREWRANILRIPFNQEWALRGCGMATAADYLNTLDRVVDSAARRGAYTLLDLQWLEDGQPFGHLPDGRPNFVPPLPDQGTPALWRLLGERYRDEPAVLFDLFNEPHSRVRDDDRPLHLVRENSRIELARAERRRVSAAEWRPWALHLTDVIREVHPNSLIFVSGVDWAHNLRGMELERPNIVYSAHVYPNRSPALWQRRFGHIGRLHPLFIGEWGGETKDLNWGRRLRRFLAENSCGWTAWSWVDRPFLVEDARRADYRPTPFGALVKQALAGSCV
jgi:endoglucanase